jgi:serine/threonine protein kinase
MDDFIHGFEIEAVFQDQGNAKLLLIRDGEELIAMKTTVTTNKKDRQQFFKEIQCLKKISHPNIISLLNEYDAPLAFTMPYIIGNLLADLIDGNYLSTDQVKRISESLFSAIAHVHKKGLLHCDLKPENVIIRDDGHPVLIDFGLAQKKNKIVGFTLGSTQYMPPEVQMGNGWSPKGEIYALGLICQQMIDQCHDSQPLEHLRNVVSKCLQEDPEDRPKSCKTVLRQLQVGPVPESSEGVAKKQTQKKGTPKIRIFLWGLLVLLFLGTLFFLPDGEFNW